MKNVLEYLEKTADRLPDKLAVTDGEESCTFGELRSISSRIGSVLAEYVTPSKPVAVMMKKSTRTLEIFLGIVYAGGFYSLLDPDFPDERHRSQLATLLPEIIVTEPETLEKVERLDYKGTVITTTELFEKIAEAEYLPQINSGAEESFPEKKLEDVVPAEKLTEYDSAPLYCNFTSGSTGVPKGVLVGHASVISFIDTFTEIFGISEEDVIGNQAPFDFDVSVKDIYSCLKTGATMVIIPTAFFRFPNNVMDMLDKYGVTTLTWAVSALVLLNRLHEFMYKIPPRINKILFSGEEMPAKHLKDWMDTYPEAEFVNLYGPTEITCNCSYYRIDRADVPEKLPIGYVFPGKEIYLIDDKGRIIPESEEMTEGEICVAGNELALGYYNNEEATARAFVEITNIGRVYKTGDLGYRKDGLLHFAGRHDFQIKHNGHRIELEEIERAMNSLPGIDRACCIYDQSKYRIVAYYTTCGFLDEGDGISVVEESTAYEKSGAAPHNGARVVESVPDKKQIVAGLKKKLPEYMLPNVYKHMEELPISNNGKIDRNKLRELA